ncbi:MAG: YbaB/EbfC family nucleoid-associated protein [Bacteroidota bacterium]
MFGDMMGKLKEAQKQMEEAKKRLDNVYVDAVTENGKIKVTATGNKKIKQISIDESIINDYGKEGLEDLLVVAVNKAIENAEKINEAEMASMAKGIMPNIPGLF